MKKLTLILTFIVSSIYADYYFLLTNQTYVVNSNPFYISDRVARMENATEQIETNITSIVKPAWVSLAEGLYTKNLTEIGYEGAWTNLNITFEDVGLDLLLKIDQTNDLALAEFAIKKKSILESLYANLFNYSKNYGITDMRLYPYGTSNIVETTNTKTYIMYNNDKYFKKDE